MKKTAASCALAVTLLASSCSDRTPMHDPTRMAAPASVSPPPAAGSGSPVTADAARAWSERKLIKTATVDLEVDDVDKAVQAIRAMVAGRAGIVAESQSVRDEDGHQTATLTVRVPSASIDDALPELAKLGRVRSQHESTADVTKAYFDVETRLRVRRQTEERLRQLLQTGTGKLSDVLDVGRELDRVVGEIEALEGEKNYYDQEIAISSITISVTERGQFIKAGAGPRLHDAVSGSLELLGTTFIALVGVLCFIVPWLLVAAAIWWVVSRVRKRARPAGAQE